MLEGLLPPSLTGLNSKELTIFSSLPWKRGRVGDENIPFKEVSFLLSSGRIEVNDVGIISPAQELLGIKPFFKQPQRSYSNNFQNEIIYIPTKKLAKFFFLHPRAMHSYVRMESNIGYQPLPEWQNMSNQWTVIAENISLESCHFALSIAHRQTKRFDSKAIYLEFQTEGLSVFNLLEQDPPPALVQAEENPGNLEELLEARLIRVSSSVDVLNIHFLSIWKLSSEQWVTLFWKLSKKYDDIVIHMGTESSDYIFEQSNTVFAVTSSDTYEFDFHNPEKNTICWPNLLEIKRKKKDNKNHHRLVEYPITYSSTERDIPMPHRMKRDNMFWDWYANNIDHFLEPIEAFVIDDYGDNFAGFVATLNAIWKDHKKDKTLKEALGRSLIFLQGKSGIPGAVASTSNDWKSFYKRCKQLVDYDVTSLLKPIFPTHGLFSEKPIEKYLKNLFPDINQDTFNIFLPVITYESRDIIFLTSGSLANNLVRSTFASGFVEPLNLNAKTNQGDKQQRTFGRTNHNDWVSVLSRCFRSNFKKVTFINFLQPSKQQDDILVKKLLTDSSGSLSHKKEATGFFSQVVNIPVSKKRFLEDKENEIFQIIYPFFREAKTHVNTVLQK